jgi:two-component system sensor histidine kinase RpfC
MFGKGQADIPHMSLDEVAVRLGDPRILKVVKGFKERSASIKRVILVMLILAWTVFWKSRAPDEHSHSGDTLWLEGTSLFPWVFALTLLSLAWAAFVWWGDKEPPDWVEKSGAVANYVGIWLMLHEGWDIAISTITFLPLATIVLGARFSRKIFYLGLAFSVVLLGTAAPPGYWAARPAFIPFALILLIGRSR